MAKARKLFKQSGKSLCQLGVGMGFADGMARQAAFQFLKSGDPRIGSLRRFARAMNMPLDELTAEASKRWPDKVGMAMSEKLLRILLSELTTVRVRCQGTCRTVVELPLEEMAGKKLNQMLKCLNCGTDFDPLHTGESALVKFAQAAAKLMDLKGSVELEFTLPDEE